MKGYSWPRPRRIFDDFVNQETRKHRKAILFLVQSSVKRSIRAACGFAFLCYWLETALHGLRALVFHRNCWRTEVLGMDVCDSGRGRPANRQSSWTRICEASAGYTRHSDILLQVKVWAAASGWHEPWHRQSCRRSCKRETVIERWPQPGHAKWGSRTKVRGKNLKSLRAKSGCSEESGK